MSKKNIYLSIIIFTLTFSLPTKPIFNAYENGKYVLISLIPVTALIFCIYHYLFKNTPIKKTAQNTSNSTIDSVIQRAKDANNSMIYNTLIQYKEKNIPDYNKMRSTSGEAYSVKKATTINDLFYIALDEKNIEVAQYLLSKENADIHTDGRKYSSDSKDLLSIFYEKHTNDVKNQNNFSAIAFLIKNGANINTTLSERHYSHHFSDKIPLLLDAIVYKFYDIADLIVEKKDLLHIEDVLDKCIESPHHYAGDLLQYMANKNQLLYDANKYNQKHQKIITQYKKDLKYEDLPFDKNTTKQINTFIENNKPTESIIHRLLL